MSVMGMLRQLGNGQPANSILFEQRCPNGKFDTMCSRGPDPSSLMFWRCHSADRHPPEIGDKTISQILHGHEPGCSILWAG